MMSTATPAFSVSSVNEAVKKEVPDWDDETATTARFKSFSGQRSDWEHLYLFWRDLILKVARNLGVCVVRVSEVKNIWFSWGALTPLCMDQVLHEMHVNGDILLRGELINPGSGLLSRLLRWAGQILGTSRSFSLDDNPDNILILKPLLQERAADVIKTLTESNWTSTCVISMKHFKTICKGSDEETTAILCHLCKSRLACYLSLQKEEFIEGIKFSLASASVNAITNFDYELLHLIWTVEKLQQQVDTANQRWENSKKMAIASLRSGNKQTAHRHIRHAKLFLENRDKCTTLLERVEGILTLIADTDSTKKVSEAMQIGTRVMKENKLSVEEVNTQLQELDVLIDDQKQIHEAIERMPLQSEALENEDVEEEFKELEMELAGEMSQPQIQTPAAAQEQHIIKESPESLSQNLSKLNLKEAQLE